MANRKIQSSPEILPLIKWSSSHISNLQPLEEHFKHGLEWYLAQMPKVPDYSTVKQNAGSNYEKWQTQYNGVGSHRAILLTEFITGQSFKPRDQMQFMFEVVCTQLWQKHIVP
jgi:hypothetical protein